MAEAGRQATWLIVARGRKVRHWRLGTVAGIGLLALCGSALTGAAIGFGVSAPAAELLVPDTSDRDRIIDIYEQRIAAMRRQVEAVNAQQANERRVMEARIAELLERQRTLTERQGQLGSVLQRAADVGGDVPMPEGRKRIVEPKRSAMAPQLTRDALAAFMPQGAERAPTPGEVFSSLDRSLQTLEHSQRSSLTRLAAAADQKADSIIGELRSLGLSAPSATGGPFIALDQPFDQSIDALDEALDKLDAAKRAAARAPIGHPVKGRSISSRFGPRNDPFNRRRAMHSGIDFRAGHGHPVQAAGAGKVVKAGRSGGYGRLIEIDHGNGVRTRYAHLKKIRVSVGQRVDVGTRIGDVGSSGRSTGPHLHYEIRKNGKAIDPMRFLRTGKSVARYL